MTTPRYPHPDLSSLPEDIRARILEVQEKAGFIPNVFLAFARRPAEWRAFFAYHDALMLKEEGSIDKLELDLYIRWLNQLKATATPLSAIVHVNTPPSICAERIKQLFVLTTVTAHWFVERGFVEAGVDALPRVRRENYNPQRRSKVLVKRL